MMTFNDPRTAQKDYNSFRSYNNGYSGHQPFIQNSNTLLYPHSSNPPVHFNLTPWMQGYQQQSLGSYPPSMQQYPQIMQSQPYQHLNYQQPNLETYVNPLMPQQTGPVYQELASLQPNMSPINHSMAAAPMPAQVSQPQIMYPENSCGSYLLEQLQAELPVPPLSKAPTRPDVMVMGSQRRPKRKSKFTKLQDSMIIRLKKEGRLWVEIADMAGVGSYLAARNRYQVIVGQQGNNNSLSWTAEDRRQLQLLLDVVELEKWRYVALELFKATGKNYTLHEVREFTRQMLWQNPSSMGVSEKLVVELQREKKITERVLLQTGEREHFEYMRKQFSPDMAMENVPETLSLSV